MKIYWLVFALGVALQLTVLPASSSASGKLKACWIYPGSVGAFGYTHQHDLGRLAVERALADKVETVFLENVRGAAEIERGFETLIGENCRIIFGASASFASVQARLAEQHPGIRFENATGAVKTGRLGTYNARFYEGRYVEGQIAARESRSGSAGYIAPFPVPEVVLGINAFVLGARSVDRGFKVSIAWTHSWHDPQKEADAAAALMEAGADVIAQHTDSAAPLQLAEALGKRGFGQSSDMLSFAPKADMTSLVDEWSAYYIRRVQAVLDGTWTPEHVWLGVKDGTVTLAPLTNVSEGTRQMAQATVRKIQQGWGPFTGPIARQDGSPWLKAGEAADDDTLRSMNFYVEGVEGTLPPQ